MSCTIIEIIEKCTGVNEYGKPNSAIAFNVSQVDTKTKEVAEKSEVHVCSATVNFKKVGDFITIDFVFANSYAFELNKLWLAIELYGELITNFNDNENIIPINGVITVLPISLNGKNFISAVNPIHWTLMPSQPNSDINTIRLLFRDTDVLFLEGEEVDTVKLREQIEKEIQLEEAQLKQMQDRIEEEEEFREQRNAKIESFRAMGSYELTPLQRKRLEENKVGDVDEE